MIDRKKFKYTISLLLFAICFLFCSKIGADDSDMKNVLEVIRSQDNLSEFSDLIDKEYLENVLENEGPFTIFAPTNEVFEAMPLKVRDLWDKGKLKPWKTRLLINHIVGEYVEAPVTNHEISVNSLGGNQLVILNSESNELTVNNAIIIDKNIEAKNGLIHVVDSFIIP